MAKRKRTCIRYGRGKGGRRVCRKYAKTTAKRAGAWSKYRSGVRRGLKSGRYKVKCSSFTERLFGGKRRKQHRCRDMKSGKFTYGSHCGTGSRCFPKR